jgi:hypothetical protein
MLKLGVITTKVLLGRFVGRHPLSATDGGGA